MAATSHDDSQTAQEFIDSQLQLEADAREALPYQFDTCTRPLGALRQCLFACLTCNPPPQDSTAPYTAAGVCYSCSICCHGDHTLVELFNKRDFVCDCGTTRLPATSPCTVRPNAQTGTKGDVHSETPAPGNKYNQNFRNRFCGCGEEYDPHRERGTMFQCLGLGSVDDGGCGEDWWHPECVVGIGRGKNGAQNTSADANGHDHSGPATNGALAEGENTAANGSHPNGTDRQADAADEDDPPLPAGFPKEDDFDHFICYKCVDAFPWIKRYAGTTGFPFALHRTTSEDGRQAHDPSMRTNGTATTASDSPAVQSKKRKADPDHDDASSETSKRHKPDTTDATSASDSATRCTYSTLPPSPTNSLSLFLREDFRNHICRCPACFPRLQPHRALLEEEESFEPPLSSDSGGQDAHGRRGSVGEASAGTGSLLERGEAALSNVDRVRAIEGVMVYNHLRDKVKTFLQPFAESGKAVGAEDIKAYFEKLRGDAEAIRAAGAGAAVDEDGDGGSGGGKGTGSGGGDSRKGQTGY